MSVMIYKQGIFWITCQHCISILGIAMEQLTSQTKLVFKKYGNKKWSHLIMTNLKIQNPTYSFSVLQGIEIKQLFSS